MKIKVKLFGSFRKRIKNYSSEQGMEVEVQNRVKVRDLLYALQISPSEGGMVISGCKVLDLDSIVEEGMYLSVFPSVSGG